MQPSPLLLDGLLATAAAVLYAFVGTLTLRRETSGPDARRAVRLFAVWWYGLAALTVVGTLRTLVVVAGYTDPALHNVFSWITIAPLVAVLWGLVSYLAYIYTGDPRSFSFSTAFHLLLLFALVYLVVARPITGVALGTYGVQLTYGFELPVAATAAIIAAIILPVLLAAIAYASLYFRTDDRSARYRIAMVSGAFVFWFGSVGLGGVLRLSQHGWWPIASRVIALVATLMVLAAYLPPRWVRESFGIRAATTRPDVDKDRRMRLARSVLLRLSGAS